jgi:benzylsuccinate CoA-transferase BbsF subunit
MGLGYDKLTKIKHDIILLRISIQGQTGPHAQHPGYGILAASLAGITGITGWPDRIPSTPVAGYSDTILPRFAASMALAALSYKQRTGRGQCIDLSQFEVSQHFLAPALLDYSVNKRVATRQGNFSPFRVPHNTYRCSGDDRWCVISISTDSEWAALCRIIGKPELCNISGFTTIMERKKNEAEIDNLIQDWTKGQFAEEVVNRLQEAGIPAGVVQNAKELLDDPQLERSFWHLNHAEIGPFYHLGQSFTFQGEQPGERRSAPCLGQDTEYVCRQILGIGDEEFIELLDAGLFN